MPPIPSALQYVEWGTVVTNVFKCCSAAKVGLWIGTTHAQKTIGISTAIEMMLGLNGVLDQKYGILDVRKDMWTLGSYSSFQGG